ncbi:MAG TPA: nucleotidyltransferase domain-containing protein [bacterium]|nr:nucleotidyltransferase domain-containing protein [bacterium]
MKPVWAITPEKVETAIRKIIEVSKPRKLIIFGSYVQGTVHTHSDLDILVVTGDEIENTRRESVRIRRELRGIGMPMDILVVPESHLEAFANTPGMIYREVLKNGRIVYEAAK